MENIIKFENINKYILINYLDTMLERILKYYKKMMIE